MTRAAAPTIFRPPAPVPPAATLVIETPGTGTIEPRALMREDCTVGRDSRCDVTLDHPTVSRLHARLWRDANGWHFQDLGSQNGSRLNAAFVATPADLVEGAELHIGRIRAWFFGAGGVPETWRPRSEDAEHAGRLVRCKCGHIGWAPDHAAGMRLPCARCGNDLIIRERATSAAVAPEPVAPAAVQCAACHSPIAPGDADTTCNECHAQMHADCWTDNRGCATYGCSQVNALETSQATREATASAEPAADDELDPPDPPQPIAPPRPALPLYAAQTILVSLLGLPSFGAPAIAYAVYRSLVGGDDDVKTKRFGYVLASFLAGVFGFIASSVWWLGGIR